MSSAWDGSTRFWDAGSGELLFVSRAGFGIQFSRDDTGIGYVRENQGLGVWKVSHSTIYRTLKVPLAPDLPLGAFDFSPDGRLIVVPNAGGVHLFERSTGAHLAYASHRNNHSAWFTADGERIVLVGADHLHAWRVAQTGREIQLQDQDRFEFQPRAGLDAGSVTHGLRHLLAVPSFDQVFFVDLGAPGAGWVLPGHGLIGAINSAAISPDTNWIATSYWKGRGTSAWDTRSRQRISSLGAQGGFVAFSPDSRRLLVGSAHAFALWETGTWRRLWEISRRSPGELVGVGAFSPDGRMVALCPELNLLQLVEAETGRKIASLHAPTSKNTAHVAFSPDGATLGVSTFENEIQLWNLPETRRQLATFGLEWPVENPGEPSAIVNGVRPSPGAATHINSTAPRNIFPGDRNNDTASRSTARAAQSAANRPSGMFYLLACLGVLVAVCTGVYTVTYQQRMMRNYEEIDWLASQRAGELKLAHAELLHSQKMKALGTLAAGIAHDFNNLLSVIRMGNNFLRRQDMAPEEKTESSAAVERAVEQGKKIVRSMLGYSREQPESRQTYSVPELVDEVVLLLSQQFLSGLTLTLELDRHTPSVSGARGHLEQILLNLIVNAAEAMDGKGRLRIAVSEAPVSNGEFVLRPSPAARYVELVVTDSGPGIEPGICSRIFEPFFSTKPQSAASGTGLGLSLVHSLAEQEGMGIRVQSEPGRGTAFAILVPVAKMTNEQ